MRLGASDDAEAAADAFVAVDLDLEAPPRIDAARLIVERVDVLERLERRAMPFLDRARRCSLKLSQSSPHARPDRAPSAGRSSA